MEKCHDILYGEIKMYQPDECEGLRVNVDTILLAHFTRPKQGEKILELGCAHGAVSLILAKRGFSVKGIDIQPHLIGLAKENAVLNALDVDFCVADIREYKKIAPAQSFDRIVVNPPYDEEGSCRKSPSAARSAAVQGACCSLADVVAAAHYLLKNRGRLDIIIRSDRLSDLFALLSGCKTPPKLMKCVHPQPGSRASVVLVEAVRSGGSGLAVEAPLFIKDESGAETAELKAAYIITEGV
ncbi:MAG: methyltransferase domain-containing protein [Synergistes sp.]|nr:methyltransferase domain-containing protein [Synergistes sp.]